MLKSNYSPYCIEKCPAGIKYSEKILGDCDSVWDAVFDMHQFIDHCNCPYQTQLQSYNQETSRD